MPRRIKQFSLLVGDAVVLYLALWLALLIRYWGSFNSAIFKEHLLAFTIVFAVWLTVFFISGLYSLGSIWNIPRTLRGFAGAMVANASIAVLFFYFLPYFGVTPKTILFLYFVIFVSIFPVWRLFYGRFLRVVGATIKLVIIGSSPAPLELARTVHQSPELGYNVVAIFNLSRKPVPGWLGEFGVPVEKNLTQLQRFVKKMEVNAVVVSNELYPQIFDSLYQIIPTGVDFYNLATFWEEVNRSIPISEANEIWFLDNLRGVRKRLYETRKRTTDIVFSIFFGLVVLLLSPFIALGIKLTDGGPVFYRQKRVGRNGKVFKIIKFRTMIPQAEKNGAQWATTDDRRITNFGRFLRGTRLDELPQLVNVLKGSMSFIGPRPERPEFVKKLEKSVPHYNLRHLIRPGLTGWAQVNFPYGSSEKDAERKLRYDLYYLKHRSLLLDAEIILKTIGVVISRGGR